MKIAIYDKWLSTLGGGEKVATVMAEVLSKHGYDVDLVSNFEVDKKELQEKMGVDLANVKMVAWYERSYFKLLPKTRKYDLLINVSFMDHMPSKAKRSIYYVHFPTPMKTTFLGFIKYEKILPFLRRFLIIPEIQSGINPVDDVYTRSGRWLSERNTIVFSNIPKDFLLTLRIYIEQLSLRSLKSISFGSPNANIKVLDSYIDHYFNVGVFKLKVNASGQDALVKIFISEDTKSNGFGLVSMAVRNIRFILWNFLKRYLPRYEMALYGSSSYRPGEGLDTYELFLANSEFTKYWTKKYLNKEAKILYPPVDIDKFKSGRKKNIILNLPFEGLKKLYSAAKIYWHATGFGEDTRANPIAFEHFGITVVEAMAAGVVPIVFNGGGLTETVSKESGIVWNSCGELIKVTSKLISDAGLLKKLSKGAIERSKLFSKSRFEKELLKYVEE